MRPHLVLFAPISPLLRGVLQEALAQEPDVEVLAAESDAELVQALRHHGSAVVVTEAAPHRLPERFLRLMERFPTVRLLSLSPDGRSASVYRLCRRVLADVSLGQVLEVVRGTGDAAGAEE